MNEPAEESNMGVVKEEAQLGDIVDFEGDSDTLNPQNWPMGKKVYTTALWALTTCWITFASAIYSAGTAEISQEFHVSYEVANAGTSLLIFGFALGPMLWAPLCEVYGRKWPALAVRLTPLLLLPLLTYSTYRYGPG
jgi:MFS family permease